MNDTDYVCVRWYENDENHAVRAFEWYALRASLGVRFACTQVTPRSFVLIMQRHKRPNVPNGLIRSMQKSYETQGVSLKKRNVDATSTDDVRLTGSCQPVVQHLNRYATEQRERNPHRRVIVRLY